MIVDSPDLLPEVLARLLRISPDKIKRMQWLFPRAILVPGIQHIVDNTLKTAVNDMSIFPRFLTEAKAVASFMRSKDHRVLVKRQMPDNPDYALCRHTLGCTPPQFARWRWNTLRFVRVLGLARRAQSFRHPPPLSAPRHFPAPAAPVSRQLPAHAGDSV
jgi:hypothetical protein